MPAKSKQQQKFFGVVKAMQAGDLPKKGAAGKVAKDMSKKEVDKYASTKHKGLPKKVKKETMKISDIKKMIGEELQSLTEIDQKVFDIYAVLGKALTKANMVPKAYRADYGQSLINMSMRDEKEFIDTYGDSDIDDFIEDMEYNLQNEGKLNEGKFKVGDIVIPNVGAHKGVRHTVIHDFRDGRYNIQPIGLRPNQIQYRLGAASANEDQLKKVSSGLQKVAPSIIDTSGMSKADIIKALGEAKMTPAKVQKAQRELVATIQLLKKNFPMYKAAKESGDEKKLEKHRDIAVKLTQKKKQLELALDKALGGLYQDAELELKEAKLNEANNMYDDVLTLKRSFDIFKQQSPDLYKQLDAKFKVKNIQKTLGDMIKFMDTPAAMREATIPKFKTPVEAYKWIMGKRGEAMDIEDEMRETSQEIQQLYGEMEQEAEAGGGPIADRYGRDIEALEDRHKDLRAEFDMVMAEIDEYDQNY